MKIALIIILILIGLIGVTLHATRAEKATEYGAAYNRDIKWVIGYGLVTVCGIGLSLDFLEPAAPTIEELNDNPAWHNWLAGGIFVIILAVFAYFVWKKIYKK